MIQSVNAFDVFVFPSGARHYRCQVSAKNIPTEAQCYPVGCPEYRAEIVVMRAQAKKWLDDHAMTDEERVKCIKHSVDFDVCYSESVTRNSKTRSIKQQSYLQGEGTGRIVHKLGD